MRRAVLLPGLPFAVAFLGACSGREDGTEIGRHPPAEGASFEAGPFVVKAGQEEVMCSFIRMDNDEPVEVHRLTGHQTEGGHHLIVYTVDHPIDSEPVPCFQGGQPGWSQIFVTQLAEESVEMPPGVGFELGPHQQLVIETHFINTTDRDLSAGGGIDFLYASPGTVTERAAPVFFGTTNIDIPPRGTSQVGSTCSPPDEMHVFRLFGHEHRFGTGVRVDVGPKGGPLHQLYASKEWEHPAVKTLDLTVGPEDSVRVTCDWDNPSRDRVFYPDEMCFAIGMYWPSHGQLYCVTAGLGEECQCFYMGQKHTGPGGAEVTVRVGREERISGVAGDPSRGDHLYCALFAPDDWRPTAPTALASYTVDIGHVPLGTSRDRATLVFRDVSPGPYWLHCFMDTVGGGIAAGRGTPAYFAKAPIDVHDGARRTVEAVLNMSTP